MADRKLSQTFIKIDVCQMQIACKLHANRVSRLQNYANNFASSVLEPDCFNISTITFSFSILKLWWPKLHGIIILSMCHKEFIFELDRQTPHFTTLWGVANKKK